MPANKELKFAEFECLYNFTNWPVLGLKDTGKGYGKDTDTRLCTRPLRPGLVCDSDERQETGLHMETVSGSAFRSGASTEVV